MSKATLHVPDWKWNIWLVDPKTGAMKKWLGMISDEKSGLNWVKGQKKPRNHFKINNVPPAHGRTQNPAYEVYADEQGRHRGVDLPQKDIPGKTDVPTREERAAERKRKAARKSAPKVAPKAAKPKDTKEMQKIKADAAALLQQHRADEQAEMEESDG